MCVRVEGPRSLRRWGRRPRQARRGGDQERTGPAHAQRAGLLLPIADPIVPDPPTAPAARAPKQPKPQAYEERLSQQRSLSKEMALLLQRKSAWGPADVARFTEVYASEHSNEATVATSKAG